MPMRKIAVVLWLSVFCGLLVLPALAQEKRPALDKDAAKLVGRWVISETKEPGKPYREGYRGRTFVLEGPNSFTLIMEYNRDGTFRRISRVSGIDTVHEGTWTFSGHELRHRRKMQSADEVMYVRFDSPDEFTSIEVYEDTSDPGLFARFKRMP